MERKTITIDATDKVLGRLATEVASLLIGKGKPEHVPYQDCGDSVVIENVSKMKVTGRKLEQKSYFRHSDYLGGVYREPLKKVMTERPEEALRRAVMGMLPKNRLRPQMIKRLEFKK